MARRPKRDPDEDAYDDPVWERWTDEPARSHAAFRLYRNTPAYQRDLTTVADQVGQSVRRVREWAVEWEWRERADAWDDACHRVEDEERLEAIRSMHQAHRLAGRTAMDLALTALQAGEPIPIGTAARLLEIGAKLERSTLVVSVEELQGLDATVDEEDPWAKIAAELDPTRA